jgi:hypothetical protein
VSSWEWQAGEWLAWARTPALEEYARALEAAGLLIDRLREPPVPPAALRSRPGYERWQRLPNFLHLRAIKAT